MPTQIAEEEISAPSEALFLETFNKSQTLESLFLSKFISEYNIDLGSINLENAGNYIESLLSQNQILHSLTISNG